MSRMKLIAAFFCCAAALPAMAAQAEKFELQPAGEGLLAPAGFKLSLVAAEPLVNNPAAMAVAPDGRIFVCEDYVHAKVPGHTVDNVKVLIGAENGGAAREAVLIADNLGSVQGLAFYQDRLYIHHAPKLSVISVSPDNKAGPIQHIFDGIGIDKPNVKHSHGASNLVFNEGKLHIVFGDQGCDFTDKDGRRIYLDNGAVLRCDPDGANLEIFAHGFRNTYGIAFDGLGNGFSRDNTNDGGGYNVRSYHIVKGTYFGWPFRWRDGDSDSPPVDVLTRIQDNGGGSPCGVMYLNSAKYPAQFNQSFYFCEWGRGAIIHGKPAARGATFDLPEKTFIADAREKGAKYDFRPTAMEMAPDGSMIIADWGSGSLYPTTKKGRVLRVTYSGEVGPVEALPAAATLTPATPVAELTKKLSSADALERARAAYLLGERKHTESGAALVKLLADADPVVRLRAATALGDLKDAQHVGALAQALAAEKERYVRHLIVRGLREIGDQKAVLKAIESAPPQAQVELLFALREIYELPVAEALIEVASKSKNTALRATAAEFLGLIAKKEKQRWTWGDRPHPQASERSESWEGSERVLKQLYTLIRDPEISVRAAALKALQKLNDTTVVETVLAELKSGARKLDDETAHILAHSAGSERAEETLASYVKDTNGGEAVRLDIVRNLSLSRTPVALGALRAVAFDKSSSGMLSSAAIDGLARQNDKASAAQLQDALKNGAPEAQRAAARALGIIGDSGALDVLIAAAQSSDRALRAQALIALWRFKDSKAQDAFLKGLLALPAADDAMQAEIVDAFAGAGRDKVEPILLLWLEFGSVGKASEGEILEKIQKWSKQNFNLSDRKVREAALKKLREYRAKQYPKLKLPEKSAAVAAPAEDEEARAARLMEAALNSSGDAARGAVVFRNKRGANCISCHAIRGEGAKIGPELTEVGTKYPRPALVESVLYPSKQLLDGYEQSLLTLASGERVSGIVQAEDGGKLTVAKSDGSIATIPAAEVKKRVKNKNSLMPDGLVNAMSDQEFFDLMAYLETLKK